MGGVEDLEMGFQHGNEVSEVSMSSVYIEKSLDGSNPFLGSGWDPFVSLSQSQNLVVSSMVSGNELGSSSYPIPLENQAGVSSSTSHLSHCMSDYGNGSYSETVGIPECNGLSNTWYQANYNPNKDGGINENLIAEEGATGTSAANGNRRKRAPNPNSPFSPNKSYEGEVSKRCAEKNSDALEGQEEKKPRVEENAGADFCVDQTTKKAKDNSHGGEAPNENFIHVRARRGQATNSHSLAERIRREKISERMRLLQELVPGCNKITGKAVMLDEIINYVQSLQQQVEFLSMKLATVNPELNFDIDCILSKNILHSSAGNASLLGYNYQGTNSARPFHAGSVPGTLPTVPKLSSLPLTFTDNKEYQSLYQMGYDSRSAMDNIGPNGN